jgi:O-methyltransferase
LAPPTLAQRVKTLAAHLGLEVSKYGVLRSGTHVVGGQHYAAVAPLATYSPWLDDQAFQRIFRAISANTLVDQYRCFELWDLLGQVRHLPGALLEVGVWRGRMGALIAARAAQLGIERPVYLCDTFEGVAKAGAQDTTYEGGEHADTSEAVVQELLRSLSLSRVTIVKGIFPESAAETMKDERFSFVHIDVDVYQSAKDVLAYCWPRMPVGAMVVFDDFGFDTCDGIPKLVAEVRGEPDKVVLHNLNGHAVVVKTR